METIQSKLWAMTVWVVIVKLLLPITNPLRVHLTSFLPDKLCLSDIALPLILICFLIATAWWLDETIVLHICNAHLILGVFKCFAWMSKCSFYMTVVRKHESVLVLQCQWSERTGLLGKKMWEYLNRRQKHLHSGHSCVSSTPCDCSATRTSHFPCTSRCPARCHPSLDRSRHSLELQWPCHIPAACTQPGRPRGPRSRHKLSPTVLCNRSQRDLHIGAFRSPAERTALWERGDWAQNSQANKLEGTVRSVCSVLFSYCP